MILRFDFFYLFSPVHHNLDRMVTITADSSFLIFFFSLQIIRFSIDEGGKFYFYNNVETFEDEPHTYNVAYEEDLCVLDEIYSRQIFLTPLLR